MKSAARRPRRLGEEFRQRGHAAVPVRQGPVREGLRFESQGAGWAYGPTPTVVLTTRDLPRRRDSVEFWSGDLSTLVTDRLRPRYQRISVAGGGAVAGECLRLALADEVSFSIVPIVIGEGVRFVGALHQDLALHLAEVQAYRNGLLNLRYEVAGRGGE